MCADKFYELEARLAKKLRIVFTTESPCGHGADIGATALANRRGYCRTVTPDLTLIHLAAGLAFVHFRETPPESRVRTAAILPPEGGSFSPASDYSLPVISPDGRRIVFGARTADKSQLWIRPLDSPVAQPLAGTEMDLTPTLPRSPTTSGIDGR